MSPVAHRAEVMHNPVRTTKTIVRYRGEALETGYEKKPSGAPRTPPIYLSEKTPAYEAVPVLRQECAN